MKKIWKIILSMVIIDVLLLVPVGSAYAGEKNPPPDPNGFITLKREVSIPGPGSNEQPNGQSPVPNATQPGPGGGTLTAVIGLEYNSTQIRGYGQDVLSSGALLLWKLCGQVNYLKRNGILIASTSETCSVYYNMCRGQSWTVRTSLVNNPHGSFTEQTSHQFLQVGGWSWTPSLTYRPTCHDDRQP
jgi:hypothetical protein